MKSLGERGRETAQQLDEQSKRVSARSMSTRAFEPEAVVLDRMIPEPISKKLPSRRTAREEKLIRPDRFALLVRRDTFARSDISAWRAQLEHARPHLERAIRATGRLEIENGNVGEHIGTGWLVAPNLVVTNRHVALEFAWQKADGTFDFRTHPGTQRKWRARIDFREESRIDEVLEFRVIGVRYIAPDNDQSPDLAILEIATNGTSGEPQPDPLPLFAGAVEREQLIAAIGYPAEDPYEVDRDLMNELFGADFSVKRLSPGKVMSPSQDGIIRHDCATLGGSSGSPLIDLATGGVVGVHFSGQSRIGNYAIGAMLVHETLAATTDKIQPKLVAFDTRPLDQLDETRKGTTRAAEHFKGRNGYQSEFLGQQIPLPMPTREFEAELATLVNAPDESELKYHNFSVRQNKLRRLPWITAVNIDGSKLYSVPRLTNWARDGRLLPEHQVGDEVYTGSGFSRGHMVRRLDPCWGDERSIAVQANADTFVFTNACPQEQVAFNDGLWGDLEDLILQRTDDDDIRVSVFTGPMFSEDDPFIGDLKSPMSFYKIVAWRQRGRLRAVGFVLVQSDFVDIERFHGSGKYGTFERPIATIGAHAAVDFGPTLLAADVNQGDETVRRLRRIRSVEDLERHFVRATVPEAAPTTSKW